MSHEELSHWHDWKRYCYVPLPDFDEPLPDFDDVDSSDVGSGPPRPQRNRP